MCVCETPKKETWVLKKKLKLSLVIGFLHADVIHVPTPKTLWVHPRVLRSESMRDDRSVCLLTFVARMSKSPTSCMQSTNEIHCFEMCIRQQPPTIKPFQKMAAANFHFLLEKRDAFEIQAYTSGRLNKTYEV
jgi:hypothetical protein